MTFPKISIVTPSYNQGKYLEQTIRSVLGQGYPNLEYIIMDGGSTDNSVEIIKRYESKLAYWETRPDKGQPAAVAKGFDIASGIVLGWLNSDDLLLPGCLFTIASKFPLNNSFVALAGRVVCIDQDSHPVKVGIPARRTWEEMLLWGHRLHQMATFWTQKAYRKVGGFDSSMQFAFDYDLFIKLRRLGDIAFVDNYLAGFRLHETQKTVTSREIMQRDCHIIYQKYGVNSFKKTHRLLRRIALPQRTRDALAWIRDKKSLSKMCNRWRNECLLSHKRVDDYMASNAGVDCFFA